MILNQEENSNVKCINRLEKSLLSSLECMNIKFEHRKVLFLYYKQLLKQNLIWGYRTKSVDD